MHKIFHKREIMLSVFVVFIVLNGFAQINYPNFKTISGLQLNGNALQKDSVLQLTSAIKDQAGSAFYLIKQSMNNGFESSFQFCINTSAYYGDGFAFVIQNDSVKQSAALGKTGQMMGYAEINNALAIEFDVFKNDAEADPDNNHIAVMCANPMFGEFILPSHNGGCLGTATIADLPVEMANNEIHKVKIVYNGSILVISLEDQQVLSVDINIQDILGSKNEGWVGFTASTGGATEEHTILSWTFKQGTTPIRYQPLGKKAQQSGQIWMNPNSQNQVFYSLPSAQYVSLNLYDSQGKKVVVLDRNYRNQGIHCIGFSSRYLANGRYFFQLAGQGINTAISYLVIGK